MALRAESEGEMRRALGERIAFEFADLDISWELRTLSGEWRTQIRAVAREVFTDVVVVGARSRIGGWGTRRLASALIADATWPVIAVP
jgi:hypothetical protein